MHETIAQLREKYPKTNNPIRCENGCGTVIELIFSFNSYKRNERGDPLCICGCCTAEEGHRDEEYEDHDDGPVCHRKIKTQLR